jgi:acetyltransferase-like isoleucine patch superfamily enzyme
VYNDHAWIVGDPEIGDGTWIGAFTLLDGSGGLRIGVGCDISTGAQIYTHSTARRCVSGRTYKEIDRAPTTLGDHVFVGAGAIVQMGVTIGDRAVIGAGAVVTNDVKPYTVVAGVPARAIGTVIVEGADVKFEYSSDPTDQRPGRDTERTRS